jgi:hypothetical protein
LQRNPWSAYSGSKILAYKAGVKYVADNKPQYVSGVKNAAPRPKNFVHIDDTAAVHIAALNSKNVKDGERFIASYRPLESYKELDPIVRNLFPEQVKSGLLPLEGEQPTIGVTYDTTSTTEKLGIEFQGLEPMVQSLIRQYVELLKKEKGSAWVHLLREADGARRIPDSVTVSDQTAQTSLHSLLS